MTANAHDPAALRAFEAFLEVHGANRSRWPAQQRLQFAPLLASSGEACRLLAEAEALEQLLAKIDHDKSDQVENAATSTPTKAALTDRIMMAALSEQRTPTATYQPVGSASDDQARSTSARGLEQVAARPTVVPVQQTRRPKRSLWPVGAMLAASLFLGVMTGVTAMSMVGTNAETAAAEAATETTYDPAVIALDSDSDGLLGGDLL